MALSNPLLEQLTELLQKLQESGIEHAAIGGLALGAHGYPRATRDLDLIIKQSDAGLAKRALEALGYEELHSQPELSSFVRGAERVDFLHAARPDSLRLIETAERFDLGPGLPVVSVEGLIGLKVQAFHNDPRRLQDLADILEVMRVNRDELDLETVRRYFQLFDREDLLDDILKRIAP